MPQPRFEVPTGPIDGVNTTFFVSRPYSAGSVAVFVNGQLKRRDLGDGWIETAPAIGQVDLKEAPRNDLSPEVVQIFYLDTSPAMVGEEVTMLRGTIVALTEIVGRLREPTCGGGD